MIRRTARFRIGLLAAVVASALCVQSGVRAGGGPGGIPSLLEDAEFWTLTETLSEPDGYFQSDNLLSNEMVFARVVPSLTSRFPPNGVYLGVGPEQNFTYIAVMRPRIAFIIDIRRGNLLLHAMYKAMFELSADRADFLSLLFARKRVRNLPATATAAALMTAYDDEPAGDGPTVDRNFRAISGLLVSKHGFGLSETDRTGLETIYRAFVVNGPRITWASHAGGGPPGRPTYAELMAQRDAAGKELSFLASEAAFGVVKDLEMRNLVVPVVGNFAGPKAIRAVGGYLRAHAATVTAFYVSNVETYLRRDGLLPTFCANVASLPLTIDSLFIRPSGSRVVAGKPGDQMGPDALSAIALETQSCGASGPRPIAR